MSSRRSLLPDGSPSSRPSAPDPAPRARGARELREPPHPPPGGDPARPERVTWVDWGILGLAVVSLGLVIVEQSFQSYFQDRPDVRRWLVIADMAICGIFLVEFLARMRHQPDKWAYTKSRWYDILGMIPVSHPFFRGFRMLRVLRIVVITSRFVRATNRTFGEMAFEATVSKFRNILVETIGDAIVLRSLGMVEPWLVRARFADRIGEAMTERRTEIRALVHDAMGRVPGGSRLLKLGGFRSMVDAAENAAVQAVIDTLRSEELNQIVQEATQNVIGEIRDQVAEREYNRA